MGAQLGRPTSSARAPLAFERQHRRGSRARRRLPPMGPLGRQPRRSAVPWTSSARARKRESVFDNEDGSPGRGGLASRRGDAEMHWCFNTRYPCSAGAPTHLRLRGTGRGTTAQSQTDALFPAVGGLSRSSASGPHSSCPRRPGRRIGARGRCEQRREVERGRESWRCGATSAPSFLSEPCGQPCQSIGGVVRRAYEGHGSPVWPSALDRRCAWDATRSGSTIRTAHQKGTHRRGLICRWRSDTVRIIGLGISLPLPH